MTTLWIIRHGQASFGDSDYDRLSDLGMEQSRILGNYFKSTGVVFDTAYTGEMKRQSDTALITLSALSDGTAPLEPVMEAAFNEYDFNPIIMGQLPGLIAEDPSLEASLPGIFKDNREFQKLFGRIMDRWISGQHDTPGVETYREYVSRVSEGLVRAASSDNGNRRLAVFTSGGVISVAMKMALELSDTESMRLGWWVKNTSVTVIHYGNGRFNLLSFNALAHLELENNPALLTYR